MTVPDEEASLTRTLSDAEDAVDALDRRIRQRWRTFKDERVQVACADVELVAEFVDRCLEKDQVAENISTALRKDETFVGRFAEIHATIKDFSACLTAIGEAGAGNKEQAARRDKLVGDLTSLSHRLRHVLGEAVDAFVAVVDTIPAGKRDDQHTRTNAYRVATEIRQQLKTRQLLKDAREKLKEVTGDVSAGNLGAHYADYANRETKSADRLRIVVAALLAVITLCAIGFNIWITDVSYNAILVRLSATIPIAVLAAYLARESSKHRSQAKDARDLAMAMHTLPYYVEPLGEDGAELRKVLGMRVFGPVTEQPEQQAESGLFEDLPKAVDALEEVLRRIRETMERREGRP